jgi:hypothetical protein
VVLLFILWLAYYSAISVIYGIKLRNLKAQVQAEGGSLDAVELAARQHGRRPLEASENAAFLYRAAGALLDMRKGPDIPEAASYEAFNKFGLTTAEQAKVVSEKRAGLEAWLRDSAIPLQLLHQAAHYEHSWFDLEYSQGCKMKMPHLAQLRDGARLLLLEAWLAAEQGDAHKALQATWAALRLRHATEDEPSSISQLVGIATDSIALRALQGITPAIRPQEADLHLILTELQSRNPMSYRLGAESERAVGDMIFESVRNKGVNRFLDEIGSIGQGVRVLFVAKWWALNTLPRDEAYYLSFMNRFVEDAGRSASLTLAELQRWEEDCNAVGNADPMSLRQSHPFSRLLLPALGRFLVEAKKDIARRDVAQCGIAAELYRLDHGAYPESLDALAPKYLAALPNDTFSGQPLLFKSLPDGILIYSVGPNGRDDGGANDEFITRPGPVPKSPADDIAWHVERKAAGSR